MMNIVPCGHRILIKVKPIEEVSSGGIIVTTGEYAENSRYLEDEGEVVAVGPTAYEDQDEPWCKVGDHVYLNPHSGIFKKDRETNIIYRLVNDKDIFGIIRS